jgi:NAD(P)-dependent dehydrogenase (short-subunit alcohol dehydrogenase family)
MTTILITGANRGIGLELAKQYKAEGADVIACCRTPAKADALKAIGVRVMELDVGDAKSAETLRDALKDAPVDILINNAGIGGPREAKPNTLDVDAWLDVFKVNSVAPVLVSFALRDNLLKGRDRKLVAITSVLGSIAENGGGMQPYRASKAAVNSLMHGLSKEWAKDGISVGIFHPGWVRTDMGGPQASRSVEQGADTAVWLATLPDGGPSGGFFRDRKAIAW